MKSILNWTSKLETRSGENIQAEANNNKTQLECKKKTEEKENEINIKILNILICMRNTNTILQIKTCKCTT